MTWVLYPDAALRMAGFPFSWWESLLPAGLLARLAAVDAEWARADQHRSYLLRTAFPMVVRRTEDREVRRLLSKLRTAVGTFHPVAEEATRATPHALRDDLRVWNERLLAVAAATDAFRAHFAGDLVPLRSRLREVAAREPLREAVSMLSPAMAEALAHYTDAPLPVPATSRDRALEHRLIRYLQRLVAKNETNSFFGPIGSASIDPEAASPLRVCGELGCSPPAVFSSPRVARSLATRVAADPEFRTHVPLRRSSMFGLTGQRLTHLPTGRSVLLSPDEVAAWRGAGAPGGPTVADRLERLTQFKALLPHVPVDLWSAEPLDSLEEWLRQLPQNLATQRWLDRIGELRVSMRSFATATGGRRGATLRHLEQRVAALTGEPPRRGTGRMYTDRSVVFEERENRLSLVIGGAAAGGLAAQLAPALTYWAATACQRWAQHQQAAVDLFDLCWPGRHEVPLPTYLAAAAALPALTAPTAAENQVADLVGETTGEVRLPAEHLHTLAAAVDQPAFSSVDLMLAGSGERSVTDGAALRWVLGEAHAGHLLSVFPTDHFARSRNPDASCRRDSWLFQALRGTGRRPAWLVTARDTKIFQYHQPAVAVQLRPYLPDAVSAADLMVRREANSVALCDGDGPLQLLPAVRGATTGFDPLAPLSYPAVQSVPFGRGALRPRVVVGNTVVQRRSWRVCAAPLARSHGVEQFLAARSFRREHGMPELVFVKLPWEPKPTLLDFRNPLSIGAFAGLLRHDPAEAGGSAVTFSEMLPGPADLWLADRRTFELRVLAVWQGARARSGRGW
jgi:hypothetical protein